jgi:protein phosphatase
VTRRIEIPELSLVLLVGASGSGKSTFARRSFLETEVLSSDRFRGWLADDENDQSVTADAFDALRYVAGKRLALGRIVVVDATNVQPEARKYFVELARAHDVLPVAIVLDVPTDVCVARNATRTDRQLGHHTVRRQVDDLRRSLRAMQREGIRQVHVLRPEEIDDAVVARMPLWSDHRKDVGPFDVIGDVHGCREELESLLVRLRYVRTDGDDGAPTYAHPSGRKAVFVGDLVDRGPDAVGCIELVMRMVERGAAVCVPGNHESRLLRKLRGKDVKLTHGLAETMAQIETISAGRRNRIASFIDDLVSHVVLDGGRLVVAHAGMKEVYQGRASGRVREFALYGETTGEIDAYGLPVRADWAAEYRGRATVVYGHTPVVEAEWVNGTICIDTGCVFGGKLTALRWPEKELVSVDAARPYAEPIRPLAAASSRGAQQEADDLLDVADVLSRLRVDTQLAGTVIVSEAQVRAALEVTSRFAADPRWLVYLPPTMSPCATSKRPGLLEHPDEALGYYREHRVARVICEEKHMGSRMVVVLARDAEAARRRFGVDGHERGVCVTRTGRRFFGEDRATETALLDRLDRALDRSGVWSELATDWIVLDAELMPWSAKAQELLRDQYAQTGSAGATALGDAARVLEAAVARGIDAAPILERTQRRAAHIERYIASYRHYCWPVTSVDDLRMAPFHVMASEGAVHTDRDHLWHLGMLAKLAGTGDPLMVATAHRVVELEDPESVAGVITWWEELTSKGGEGMVVKPIDFLVRGRKGVLQPAVKCRGPEYLRIIYGPEYPDHLDELRKRGLGRKRALAHSELALGLEGLARFVRREPLRRVHECALGVLALESEPVDPRL